MQTWASGKEQFVASTMAFKPRLSYLYSTVLALAQLTIPRWWQQIWAPQLDTTEEESRTRFMRLLTRQDIFSAISSRRPIMSHRPNLSYLLVLKLVTKPENRFTTSKLEVSDSQPWLHSLLFPSSFPRDSEGQLGVRTTETNHNYP